MEYRTTLNLPKTDFPMRAGLAKREPELLARWDGMGLYRRIVDAGRGKPPYILHDGPPYANGHIHIGHALNKVLKDIIVKSKTMAGRFSPYVPGWDCHGLPIEHKVAKLWQEGGKNVEDDVVAFRRECRRYADEYLAIQKDEFRRLGVLGEWDDPYVTMSFPYEAAIAKEFGKFVAGGYVHQGLKPVYWCADCKTALAEAEVEYKDHVTPSIFVRFRMTTDLSAVLPEVAGKPVYVVIWTTTPWTIPANLGLMFHPEFDYAAVDVGDAVYLLAERLVPGCMETFGVAGWKVLTTFKAGILEGAKARHPFMDRESVVLLAEFVTLDTGSGVVHTAPGHGQEDYEVGRRYGLPAFAPVDDEGRFTRDAPPFAGQFVFDANPKVNALLREQGALLHERKMTHSYPHCWRCKRPIIFRATRQWFVGIDHADLRKRLVREIDGVRWIPEWGKQRILGMVENRPDWCISRQRAWGIPVMAFACASCEEPLLSKEIIDRAAAFFEREGSDAWFTKTVAELLPPGAACAKCGGTEFRKSKDILDVWFDSGVSHAAVCEPSPDLGWPVDLYLEGSDQHRGWFNSALTTAVATRDAAPYRTVLTHGFVMSATEEGGAYQTLAKGDGDRKSAKYAKMSKSLGNVVAPQEVIEQYGADVLRLWVASEDYRDDTRIGPEILTRLGEAYRRIRNTWRFLLGNLSDFDPARHAVPVTEMCAMDRWALDRLAELAGRCRAAYESFEFHVIFQAVHNFCAVDLSAVYLDIAKDRMYCSDAANPARRSGQTAMFHVLDATLRLTAPILSFTADEAWGYLPGAKAESVHLAPFPEIPAEWRNDAVAETWAKVLAVRGEVNRTIERLRADKVVGNSLDVAVEIAVPDDLRAVLVSLGGDGGEDLRRVLIVSSARIVEHLDGDGVQVSETVPGLAVRATATAAPKCERCWTREETVGANAEHPALCARCVREIDPAVRAAYAR